MRFSLIVATLGRTQEPVRLFESLQRQRHRDFEVIVVDQNSDDRLVPILGSFASSFEIQHLRAAPGLSGARNLGLKYGAGEAVCFPDDDCWYGDSLLEQVNASFIAHPDWDAIVGDSVNESGSLNLPWRDRKGRLTPAVCWRRAVTYVFFLRPPVLERIGGFDEKIGPGCRTPWVAGEDTEMMLRALEADFRVEYDPAIRVYHPRTFPTLDELGREKRHRYALSAGYILRKHPMPIWWKVLFLAVPAARVLWAALRLKPREVACNWAEVTGRALGYFRAAKADFGL